MHIIGIRDSFLLRETLAEGMTLNEVKSVNAPASNWPHGGAVGGSGEPEVNPTAFEQVE